MRCLYAFQIRGLAKATERKRGQSPQPAPARCRFDHLAATLKRRQQLPRRLWSLRRVSCQHGAEERDHWPGHPLRDELLERKRLVVYLSQGAAGKRRAATEQIPECRA